MRRREIESRIAFSRVGGKREARIGAHHFDADNGISSVGHSRRLREGIARATRARSRRVAESEAGLTKLGASDRAYRAISMR